MYKNQIEFIYSGKYKHSPARPANAVGRADDCAAGGRPDLSTIGNLLSISALLLMSNLMIMLDRACKG